VPKGKSIVNDELRSGRKLGHVMHIQLNLVITSVYMIHHLQSHIFCGSNSFVTVNHNIILLGYIDSNL
jgi:hypothetical protein